MSSMCLPAMILLAKGKASVPQLIKTMTYPNSIASSRSAESETVLASDVSMASRYPMRMPQNRVRNCEIRLNDCRLFKPGVQKGRHKRLRSRKRKVIRAPVASCAGPSDGRNTRKLCRVSAVGSVIVPYATSMNRDVNQDTVRELRGAQNNEWDAQAGRGGARQQGKGGWERGVE